MTTSVGEGRFSGPGDRIFLVFVALLPLHTLFFHVWVSWKPYMVLLAALGFLDLRRGVRTRRWPWHPRLSVTLGVFLAVVMLGWPEPRFVDRFLRLLLGLAVGGAVLLVTEARLRGRPEMVDRMLRAVVWSGAAMAVTGFVFSLAALGAFGWDALPQINALPGVDRVGKLAYLREGFVALSNWHEDPGYGANWMTLWAALALVASARGLASRRWQVDALLIGGLAYGVVMTFSRTGWLGLVGGLALTGWLLVRRWEVPAGWVVRMLGSAAAVTVLLVALVWVVDDPDAGGHMGLQLQFRSGQVGKLVVSLLDLAEGGVAFEMAFDPSEGRAEVWPYYWRLFLDRPVTGTGLGVGWEINPFDQEPHNLLLELLAETGLVGLAAFGLLIATTVMLGGGLVGTVALIIALIPALTQTVLFEVSWWFGAGVFAAGVSLPPQPAQPEQVKRHAGVPGE